MNPHVSGMLPPPSRNLLWVMFTPKPERNCGCYQVHVWLQWSFALLCLKLSQLQLRLEMAPLCLLVVFYRLRFLIPIFSIIETYNIYLYSLHSQLFVGGFKPPKQATFWGRCAEPQLIPPFLLFVPFQKSCHPKLSPTTDRIERQDWHASDHSSTEFVT